jgi:hypothetical protein
MNIETTGDLAQSAIDTLNCAHPDTSITNLEALLKTVDGAQAEAVRDAIGKLERAAEEIARVEASLNKTFGET